MYSLLDSTTRCATYKSKTDDEGLDARQRKRKHTLQSCNTAIQWHQNQITPLATKGYAPFSLAAFNAASSCFFFSLAASSSSSISFFSFFGAYSPRLSSSTPFQISRTCGKNEEEDTYLERLQLSALTSRHCSLLVMVKCKGSRSVWPKTLRLFREM